MASTSQRPHTLSAMGVLVAIPILASCGIFGPSLASFLIRVDSIGAPNVIAANESLTARFYGNIGPDGCWWLTEVDRQATSATLDVTFHGEHDARSGHDCTDAPVALNHVEVVAPPLATPFTITVHQPDGLLLRRVVTAR